MALRSSGDASSRPCRHATPLQPAESDRGAVERYDAAVQETLAKLAAAEGRPAAMSAFDELFGGSGRLQELRDDSRPVVGYLCNFVPDEVVLAAGAIPLRLDLGNAGAAEAGGRVFPADVCPEVKALVGAQLGGLPYLERTDLLVIPTACDGKKKLVRALGEQREVWMLELPQTRDSARSRTQWTEEIKALAARLKKLTGRRLRRGELRRAIEQVNRRTELMRKINERRREAPGCLNGRDAFLVMQASFIADLQWWNEHAAALLTELEGRAARDDDPVKILLTGSPVLFPDLSLLQLIEETGAVVVADEMCSGTQRLHNPTVIDEGTVGGMLRAAAEKTLMPCTCPCFVSGDLRVERVLELCWQSRADGVIHHTLRLCQLFDMEVPRLTAALKAQGLPLLNLHVEYSTDGGATLKNRVDAFVEMLHL
jgi:benzoyl-CoA reductase/2-hydroxyglutaryl-CoA dehydratase subunit BcrC/BadD/HgdB